MHDSEVFSFKHDSWIHSHKRASRANAADANALTSS